MLPRVVGYAGMVVLSAACAPNQVPPIAVQRSALCAQYVEQGYLEQAEQNAKLALEYASFYAEPYNCLGLIRQRQSRLDEARDNFKRAISLNNNFAQAHSNLGSLYFNQGDIGAAIDQFKQSLEIDPGYLTARFNLGVAYIREKEWSLAREQFVSCTELDPNAGGCWMGLGSVSNEQGFTDEAAGFFERQTAATPNDPNGHFNLCHLRIRLQKCDKAVDSCLTAIALQPEHIEAKADLQEAYKCLALQDKALQRYYDDIMKNPEYAPAHCNLGVAFLERKLLDRAVSELSACVQSDPKYCFGYHRLAKAYDEQHNSEGTIVSCQKLVDCARDSQMQQEKKWCIERVRTLTLGP